MADIMNIGVTSLDAAQAALSTVSNNISNVNTPGYTRERVLQAATDPVAAGDGFFGTGVQVQTVQRLYSQFLTSQMSAAQTMSSQLSTYSTQIDQVDNLLAGGTTGLSPSIQAFFGAFQSLAGNPASVPARQAVLSSAENLANQSQQTAGQLSTMRVELNQQITDTVDSINTLAGQIANLNQQIAGLSGGNSAQVPNTLLDQRDQLVQQLNQQVKVSVYQQSDGSYNISIGSGQTLVVGDQAQQLQATPDSNSPQDLGVAYKLGNTTVNMSDASLQGGSLGGLLNFRSQVLLPTLNAIGAMAVEVARQVNAQNRMGQDLNGNLGGDLFNSVDPTVTPAATNAGGATLTALVPTSAAYPQDTYTLSASGTPLAYTVTDTSVNPPVATPVTFTFPNTVTSSGGTFDQPYSFTLNGQTISNAAAPATTPPAQDVANNINAVSATTHVTATVDPATGQLALSSTDGTAIAIAGVSAGMDLGLSNGTTDAGPATTTVPAAAGGFQLTLDKPMAAGDSFTLQPQSFQTAAASLSVAITDPAAIAAASPIATAAGPRADGTPNLGTGALAAQVTSGLPLDPNLQQPVTITFTDATHYTVSGTGVPAAMAATPIAYTPGGAGATISVNGWTATLSGQPAAGDVFTVGPNSNGQQDSTNALALAAIANNKTMDGGKATIQDVYSQLVSTVGDQAHQADIASQAQDNLLQQTTQAQQSYSGVNLDEEAASLLKYQQAYQASAKVIQMASTLFQTIFNSVGA